MNKTLRSAFDSAALAWIKRRRKNFEDSRKELKINEMFYDMMKRWIAEMSDENLEVLKNMLLPIAQGGGIMPDCIRGFAFYLEDELK